MTRKKRAILAILTTLALVVLLGVPFFAWAQCVHLWRDNLTREELMAVVGKGPRPMKQIMGELDAAGMFTIFKTDYGFRVDSVDWSLPLDAKSEMWMRDTVRFVRTHFGAYPPQFLDARDWSDAAFGVYIELWGPESYSVFSNNAIANIALFFDAKLTLVGWMVIGEK